MPVGLHILSLGRRSDLHFRTRNWAKGNYIFHKMLYKIVWARLRGAPWVATCQTDMYLGCGATGLLGPDLVFLMM